MTKIKTGQKPNKMKALFMVAIKTLLMMAIMYILGIIVYAVVDIMGGNTGPMLPRVQMTRTILLTLYACVLVGSIVAAIFKKISWVWAAGCGIFLAIFFAANMIVNYVTRPDDSVQRDFPAKTLDDTYIAH